LLLLALGQARLLAAPLRQFDPMFLLFVAVALLLVGLVLVRMLEWRRYGYAMDGDRLLVRSGWWRRRLKILPLRNIQSLEYRQNFLTRWFGIADLLIGVAGGGPTSHGIKALPTETARMIRDQLLLRFQ
jgi:putative membrane protein